MNAFLAAVDHPLAHRVGWVLLHSLWQGALVAALFALLQFALRGRSANARYLAGCAALALLLAAPVVTVFCGSAALSRGGPGASAGEAVLGTGAPVFSGAEVAYSSMGMATLSLFQRGADFFGRIAPLLAALWLLGV